MPARTQFGKFIIVAVGISRVYNPGWAQRSQNPGPRHAGFWLLASEHGTLLPPSLSDGRNRKEFFAGGAEALPYAARDLARPAAAGAGGGRKAHRPWAQGFQPDRRRAHGAGVCAALRESRAGARGFACGAARQIRRPAYDRRQRIGHAVPAASY